MAKKHPIELLTPPVKFDYTGGEEQTQSHSGGNGGGGGSGSSIPSFESIFAEMLNRYLPETVTFEPIGEDVLRETIGNWLRPAYEQAIRTRRERTRRQNAELDADAWARGMGASTYVTDVKNRAFESEDRDVTDLESDYASTLAGHLYDALRAQQEQQIAVDQFNAEQINHAREQAAKAAQSLYDAYLNAGGHSSSGGSGGSGSSGGSESSAAASSTQTGSGKNPILSMLIDAAQAQEPGTAVDYQTAANLLSRLSPAERAKLYAGQGESYARQNAEILRGIGREAYERLKAQFPA